jgi:ABC-type dipeptide/oligopeptide/nickel transport system permease subunit
MALPVGATPASVEADQLVPGGTAAGGFRRHWRRHCPFKVALGLGLLAVFVLMAIIGPMVAPYDPSAIGPDVLAPPSATHLLGTTNTGQDVLSQLLVGSRATLLVGFGAGAVATVLSVIVGISAGYYAGAGGELLSMLTNVFLVIPLLPLLVVLTAFLPGAGSVVVAVVISATAWAWGARVLRAQTLTLRNSDFVQAARAAGERGWRIILSEILPNELAIVASSFLFTVITAILTDAGLIFLGLGDTSQWSWGTILFWAQNNEALGTGAWWWFVPPGLCIALTGASLALINFGIDELLNPGLRTAGLGRRASRAMTTEQGLTPVRRAERAGLTADGGTGR